MSVQRCKSKQAAASTSYACTRAAEMCSKTYPYPSSSTNKSKNASPLPGL